MIIAWSFLLLISISSSLQRSIITVSDDHPITTTTITPCPPPSILWPCSCTLSTIYCYHGGIVRVEPILQRVAQYLQRTSNPNDHLSHSFHFIGLELDGLALLRHLPANFTAGLSFETVALKNLAALSSINSTAAFSPVSATTLQQLSFEGSTSKYLITQNLPQLQLLVSSLPNLERLYLDLLHLNGSLPRHFLVHNRLTDLSLNFNRQSRGQLTGIEDEAFYYLPALRTIDLYGQQIATVGRDAFRFQTDYGGHLRGLSTAIFLEDNHLTDDSFPVGVFSGSGHHHRQLTVHLGGNSLTTVREAIFRPLLDGSPLNKVDFGADSRLVHSCANRWVASVEGRYRQFLAAMVYFNATEHRVLVALDLEDYASLNCSSPSPS
ncbi:hypothetical protein TYRP_006145 [Tyrophagus putrescentiae]|nr:hypothetical protein TYRP_006145 [Tyrophagus putrescentiae]